MRWMMRWLIVRLGSRTIAGIGAILFLLNMLIPDPLPLIDEILMLAGTVLLSRWARREQATPPATPPSEMKYAGRGRTQP
jgi:hypothetical protein